MFIMVADIAFISYVLLDLRYRIVIVRKDEPLQPSLRLNFVDKVTPAEGRAVKCQLRERLRRYGHSTCKGTSGGAGNWLMAVVILLEV